MQSLKRNKKGFTLIEIIVVLVIMGILIAIAVPSVCLLYTSALVEAYVALKDQLKSDIVDVQKGIKVVMDALLAPIAQIAENAGYNAEEIVEHQKGAEANMGFDAKYGKWVNMFEEGIIDPTKVTRSALLNAASISALFLTTEAGVAAIKEKEAPMPPMPQGGMY